MSRKVILASHGELAKGMEHSAKMIAGEFACEVDTYSLLPGHHPDEFKEIIEKEIINEPEKEFILVTDLYGASVTTSLFTLTKYENVKMFCGMNLNLVLMLLVEYREPLTEEDINQIITDSQSGMKYLRNDIQSDFDDF